MRVFLLLCAAFAAACWADNTYNAGTYTRQGGMMLRHVTSSFR
jgi:hypothetical protein